MNLEATQPVVICPTESALRQHCIQVVPIAAICAGRKDSHTHVLWVASSLHGLPAAS